ncbi:hypothetical protein SAMN05444580_10374 [Rhodococcus tukisamuensis]|uniref:Ferredoxin--NADP+ reductase n=1 Tax=Rhodococcus tukisamuensis TaxID=168276 RepID=A0A1G6SAQ9_9NOCA|nr:hypothetical protein SAMN05444580_10374 [Rhodococcus tukisamuensis]
MFARAGERLGMPSYGPHAAIHRLGKLWGNFFKGANAYAGVMAAEELLVHSDVEVEVFEKLPTPWGLIRAGVAPDQPGTKAVSDSFDWTAVKDGFQFHLNAEVGRHLSHPDLLDHHHAVIYAVGAPHDRRLLHPRRGPAGQPGGVDVVIDPADLELDAATALQFDRGELEPSTVFKMQLARAVAYRTTDPGHRRIVFRYLTSPTGVVGDARVEAVAVVRNELVLGDGGVLSVRPTAITEQVPASLLLRSIGYRGRAVPCVPFDERRGIIPNDHGRARHTGRTVDGVYVTGWIKRGPSGAIGTNKSCAKDTVARLLEDFQAGRLDRPVGSRTDLNRLVAARQPARVRRQLPLLRR